MDNSASKILAFQAFPWYNASMENFCECGCGLTTPIAIKTRSAIGHVKGQPIRFILGHRGRLSFKHGHYMKGKRSPTYNSWRAMIDRCSGANHTARKDYFERGISVCPNWLIFENFLKDMGERPDNKSLDRFPDNDGNYEIDNCRWATRKEQQNNRR